MSRPPPIKGQVAGSPLTINTNSMNQHSQQQRTGSQSAQARLVNSYGIVSQITSTSQIRQPISVTTVSTNSHTNISLLTTTPTPITTSVSVAATPVSVSLLNAKQNMPIVIKAEEKSQTEVLIELREKILQHYYNKTEEIKVNFRERLQELFFIQSGGNMVDFPAWKLRPNPHLLSFLNVYKLDDGTIPSSRSNIFTLLSRPVQETSELISKPSQQLEQYGFVPGDQNAISTKSNGTLKIKQEYKSQIVNNNSNSSTSDDIAGQVRQEAETLHRVSHLRKVGLWSASRLPKVYEQPQKKCHWDFLLEEMQWLSTDFSQERKWKRNMAKKVSRSIMKYHQNRVALEKKMKKDETIRLKRIANGIAKEVKQFWQQIEKVACYKQRSRQEEQRRKALDLHLNFIVGQTEKYSSWLAEGMRESTMSSPISSKTVSELGDEYEPDEEAIDDERTISEEEDESDQNKYDEELSALQKDSEIPFEELLQTLPQNMLNRLTGQKCSSSDDEEEDLEDEESGESGSEMSKEESVDESKTEDSNENEDYIANEEELIDDEDTLDDEEKYGDIDHQVELNDLHKESEIPLEELLEKYGQPSAIEEENRDDEEDENSEYDTSSSEEEIETEKLEVDKRSEIISTNDKSAPDEQLTSAAATAESLQPKGFTLSTVQVRTKVPFLLQHTLREYQHIGLDWLVTMYQKQLNGILADEMGLGKTIQTIALLAHLACEEECWGPHLIVVPTSVMLNWEFEFKKWCPGFKILTYFGSQKERKQKRTGWSKPNAFHVCITSYKLVIQDHQAFRRRKWKYLILDEAQNIKNFKSQRWQMLLNFHSQRRLLLTGTPLQNSLMELWSLMHFLMPNIFQSHHDFKEWFSNPLTGMIEGSREYNEGIVKRLHTVLRPFLLRRLKSEVELQMPKKYEHVVKCRLSKRQRFLYDEFMSRTKTKETLETGNFLSVINILMQLRKVCNHPDLFELRPTVSPLVMDKLIYSTASIVNKPRIYDPLNQINLTSLNLCLSDLELSVSAFQAHRTNQLKVKRSCFREINSSESSFCESQSHCTSSSSFQPLYNSSKVLTFAVPELESSRSYLDVITCDEQSIGSILTQQIEESLANRDIDVINIDDDGVGEVNDLEPVTKKARLDSNELVDELPRQKLLDDYVAESDSPYYLDVIMDKVQAAKDSRCRYMACMNDRHCDASPVYGTDLHQAITLSGSSTFIGALSHQFPRNRMCQKLQDLIKFPEERFLQLKSTLDRYYMYVHPILSPTIEMRAGYTSSDNACVLAHVSDMLSSVLMEKMNFMTPLVISSRIQFPETRLVQYDCGKLQALDELLRKLKAGKHRVLVFTQMTKMLNVLERFLNYHGYIYLRLDGTTKVEQRQVLMERFNQDAKIFCFILSTRSGGIGVNLTGADTVVFYDSDWNPTMDAQAQDRCHRIGQTRDVHIYRLICDRTVEENILKKAHQKRMLGNLAIEGGKFTAAFFKQDSVKDLFNVTSEEGDSQCITTSVMKDSEAVASTEETTEIIENKEQGTQDEGDYEEVLAAVEEEEDVKAAINAKAEQESELTEFNENVPLNSARKKEASKVEKALALLEAELKPIEQFALRYMESTNTFLVEDEVEETEKLLEQKKKEWELDHLQSIKEAEERKNAEEEDDMFYTYARDSTYTKHYVDDYTGVVMPIWMPPTPPRDGEIEHSIDHCMTFLYESGTIPENHLPPTHHLKKHGMDLYAMKRNTSRTHYLGIFKKKRHRITKHKSLFDKKALELLNKSKLKKSQKLKQKSMSTPQVSSSVSTRPDYSQHGPEWLINEDWALLQALNTLSELPLDFPNEPLHSKMGNWELAADIVNSTSRIRRSARQCRDRYLNVILPREDGKFISNVQPDKDDVKLKKNKKNLPPPVTVKNPVPSHPQQKTHVQFNQDHGKSVLSMHCFKFDSVKKAAVKRKPTVKQPNANKYQGGRHAQILAANNISSENPFNPKDLAIMRAERIAKEKAQAVVAAQQQQHQSTTVNTTTQSQATTRQTIAQIANLPVSAFSKNGTQGVSISTGGIRGSLVFTSSGGISGNSIVVNPSVVCTNSTGLTTTSSSFAAINRKIQNVTHIPAVSVSGTGRSQSHIVSSQTGQILPGLISSRTSPQSALMSSVSSTPSSVVTSNLVAPNVVVQAQKGASIAGVIGTTGSLITTQPFIQGKPLTQQQIAILRQKAAQQQQLQKLQQQQRFQKQQQLKLLQQQQLSSQSQQNAQSTQQQTQQPSQLQTTTQTLHLVQSQTSSSGHTQPVVVVTSNQLGNLTVQTVKSPVTLRGSVPQQIMTQPLTAAQQQQLLQQTLKKQQFQHLQQRAQLASSSQIQQMLAGQKLTPQQLQQLQQQQRQTQLQQQQLKFNQQQVTATIVTQPKAQLVMTQVKQGQQGVQSIKTTGQQIQLQQLQQTPSSAQGSLPQQILLRPTLSQVLPQQIQLRAMISQQSPQQIQRVNAGGQQLQAMQAQVNLQTGTVVMQPKQVSTHQQPTLTQVQVVSSLAQQPQRNIQAAVQKQVQQQQQQTKISIADSSSTAIHTKPAAQVQLQLQQNTTIGQQLQRQQVLSATAAQLSQVKAFVSQAQLQASLNRANSPSVTNSATNLTAPTSQTSIQLQAQHVNQQMRNPAQLVQVQLKTSTDSSSPATALQQQRQQQQLKQQLQQIQAHAKQQILQQQQQQQAQQQALQQQQQAQSKQAVVSIPAATSPNVAKQPKMAAQRLVESSQQAAQRAVESTIMSGGTTQHIDIDVETLGAETELTTEEAQKDDDGQRARMRTRSHKSS